MQRLPSILTAVVLTSLPVQAGGGEQIFHLTAHGNSATGVSRLTSVPRGHCQQCHLARQAPLAASPMLFTSNDNGLCFTCHQGAGPKQVFAGETAFTSSSHATATTMRWPGPFPPVRPVGDQGKCINCHTPHGSRDGQGLVPNLEFFREEALCLACHDGSGPATTNIATELTKARAHPVVPISARHQTGEGTTSSAFRGPLRHAECSDCHNPHAARPGAPLVGVSRVQVTNGAAGTVPSYLAVPASNTGPVREFELCFKCHSSWTGLDGGADLAMIFNPANESFHPVEAAGRNTTSTMANSLDGGLGSPKLSVASVITCGDCHNNDAIPRTVTLVSTYTGTAPTGPHGSNVTTPSSGALLRAPYRTTLKVRASANDYVADEFALCFICHSPTPFATTSTNTRTDTSFRYHGFHLNRIYGQGSASGDITTPGAGSGNAICRECHYNTHGTRGAAQSTNATYAKGVNFSPNVVGPSGVGQPQWTPGSCRLRCHGTNHNPESY